MASEGPWLVVAGNFADGWRAIGPFSTAKAASDWSSSNAPTWEGLVAEIVRLEDPDSVTWPD